MLILIILGAVLLLLLRYLVNARTKELQDSNSTLATSEEKFRRIFHNDAAAKFIADPEDLQILEVNQAALDLYGYSEEQMLNMKVMSD